MCRRSLQAELGLQIDEDATLLAIVSRLSSQKGLDLVLAALPELLRDGVQLAMQGSGEPALEAAFRMAQQANPTRVQVRIGYDEARAHRLIAGADLIAVPSRFEPCGLTQLYGLRYGTLPVVRRVGGLADTVVDDQGPEDRQSTGFAFNAATPSAFARAVSRAVDVRSQPERWLRLMHRGMAQTLGWEGPARDYLALYSGVLRQRQESSRG